MKLKVCQFRAGALRTRLLVTQLRDFSFSMFDTKNVLGVELDKHWCFRDADGNQLPLDIVQRDPIYQDFMRVELDERGRVAGLELAPDCIVIVKG